MTTGRARRVCSATLVDITRKDHCGGGLERAPQPPVRRPVGPPTHRRIMHTPARTTPLFLFMFHLVKLSSSSITQ